MKIQLLFILLLTFVFSTQTFAVKTVAVDGENTTVLVNNETQKTNVFQKIGNWYKNTKLKAAKWVVTKLAAVDFNDPASVIKLAIILILASIVLWIGGFFVSLLFTFSYIVSLIGFGLFWYWVYLKYVK